MTSQNLWISKESKVVDLFIKLIKEAGYFIGILEDEVAESPCSNFFLVRYSCSKFLSPRYILNITLFIYFRLHHRQLTHQSRRGRPEEQSFADEREESPVWSGWPSLFGSQPQQQHPEGSAGERQADASQNVVIDIEAGGSPERSLPSTSDLSNSEQFTHTIDGEGPGSPGGLRTREPPDHLNNTPSELEPLLPAAASGVAAVAGENGNTSDAANEDNANNRWDIQ